MNHGIVKHFVNHAKEGQQLKIGLTSGQTFEGHMTMEDGDTVICKNVTKHAPVWIDTTKIEYIMSVDPVA